MTTKTCPFLGVLGPEQNQQMARDFPSFENCCFTEPAPDYGTLLLADQATYCISGGFHQCPRFQTRSIQTHSASIQDPHLLSLVNEATTSLPLDSEFLANDDEMAGPFVAKAATDEFLFERSNETHQRPIWLLAGSAFATVFLLGIVLAGYIGWQMVINSTLGSTTSASSLLDNGSVITVDGKNGEQAVYLVVTATSDSSVGFDGSASGSEGNNQADEPSTELVGRNSVGDNRQKDQAVAGSNLGVESRPIPVAATPTIPQAALKPAQPIQSNQAFPVAVTPTPVVVTIQNQSNPPADTSGDSLQSVPQSASQQNGAVQGGSDGSADNQQPAFIPATPTVTPVPEINVQVIVPTPPTRRPTPEVPLIPNPVPEQPTETPWPTATWPPPIVFFGPEEPILREGKCTMVTWTVQHVREVYYRNIGVDGSGEREECITDNDKTLLLSVVLPNGGTKIYTTTLQIAEPTVTPTPTWTFTPLPAPPSPTWTPVPTATPVPPTSTPAPSPTKVIVRGVKLESAQPQNGVPYVCGPGVTCELGLLATNTGEDIDSISIVLAERSQPGWSILLCRQDGVCSGERLVLTNVGAANTAFILLRVEAPADASGQLLLVQTYASSQASGETIRSETLSVDIQIQ
ncbi:MAG: hypothetical protein AAF702_32850 [Chloroflexota bacterium]